MTPDYIIHVNGTDKTALFQDRLTSIDVVDNEGMEADTLTVVFDDRDHALPLPAFGEIIKVWLGYAEDNDLMYMGSFAVNETPVGIMPKTLTVRCKSADMAATLKEPKTRSWHKKTLGDIAKTVVGQHGLTPAISAELSAIAYPHINQSEESDLHLLTRLVREHDGMMKIADGKLIIVAKGEGKSATGRDLPTKVLNLSDIKSGGTINKKSRDDYKGVKCKWRDALKASTETVAIGSSPFYEIREPAANAELAQKKAQAKLKELKRGILSISGINIKGDTGYAAGLKMQLGSGFKPDFEGEKWVLKKVTHRYIKSGGFVTSLGGETPN